MKISIDTLNSAMRSDVPGDENLTALRNVYLKMVEDSARNNLGASLLEKYWELIRVALEAGFTAGYMVGETVTEKVSAELGSSSRVTM